MLVGLQSLFAVAFERTFHRQMLEVGGFQLESAAILLLGTEVLRNRELRHNRLGVDIVYLHFVRHFLGVGECFGYIAEDSSHLFRRLEPLLLGVVHTVHIVEEVSCAKAYQSVMRLGMLFFHEVGIVGRNHLHPIFLRQFNQYRIDLLLPLEGRLVAAGLLCLVPL